RGDVPNVMRGFDCFVLPSQAEGISNTILEAMAGGLPVVATAVGGNGELVDDGVTGTLVPPQDPDLLADALERYVSSPALGVEQGRAGRRRVEACFSLDGMVAQYAGLYQSLSGLSN
ncbi:MAG: glycosyltransferase, partial [Zoogloea sp.]|uniref:glycosyltransferase n=1 Tax=Zoogloea sp. TaxID=49181 RepID=UPI00260795CC